MWESLVKFWCVRIGWFGEIYNKVNVGNFKIEDFIEFLIFIWRDLKVKKVIFLYFERILCLCIFLL